MDMTHADHASSLEPVRLKEVLGAENGLLAFLAQKAFDGIQPNDIAEGNGPVEEAPEDL